MVEHLDFSFAQRELKWKPRKDFKDGLEKTIQWCIDKPAWWQPLRERAGTVLRTRKTATYS
jgi:dTDP-glucose 4,6-dehydratase